MKVIVTIIPTNRVANPLLPFLCPFMETKNKNQIFSNLWSGNENSFDFSL